MPFDLSSLADRISRNCDQQGDYHPPEEECRRKSSRKREETKRWIEDSAREYNPKRKKRKDKTKVSSKKKKSHPLSDDEGDLRDAHLDSLRRNYRNSNSKRFGQRAKFDNEEKPKLRRFIKDSDDEDEDLGLDELALKATDSEILHGEANDKVVQSAQDLVGERSMRKKEVQDLARSALKQEQEERKKPSISASSVSINGNGSIIGNGNTINNFYINDSFGSRQPLTVPHPLASSINRPFGYQPSLGCYQPQTSLAMSQPSLDCYQSSLAMSQMQPMMSLNTGFSHAPFSQSSQFVWPLNASSSQERQQLNSDILQFRSTCRTNHDCHWIEQYQKAVEIYIKYGASAGFCRGYNCVNDEIAEWVARQKNQMKDCDATKQKLLKRIGL